MTGWSDPVKPVKMTVILETDDRKVVFEIPKGLTPEFMALVPATTYDISHYDEVCTIEPSPDPRLLFLITPTAYKEDGEQYRMTVTPPPEENESWWPL